MSIIIPLNYVCLFLSLVLSFIPSTVIFFQCPWYWLLSAIIFPLITFVIFSYMQTYIYLYLYDISASVVSRIIFVLVRWSWSCWTWRERSWAYTNLALHQLTNWGRSSFDQTSGRSRAPCWWMSSEWPRLRIIIRLLPPFRCRNSLLAIFTVLPGTEDGRRFSVRRVSLISATIDRDRLWLIHAALKRICVFVAWCTGGWGRGGCGG